nr:arginine/serine-rich coiled-coil protein 2 isoform X2 [Ziziphus jujuba var. spinosa]XP_048321524.1 arginine/serine-rich coiled-coil protein 2 isoform X2 [Ziziphus jujuba var. spinosa]
MLISRQHSVSLQLMQPAGGSPKREHSSSPKFSREDPGKVYEHRPRRKDDGMDSDRSRCARSSDSYRNSDRPFPRSSHGYSRHDDYIRHDKHADEEERNYQRLSSRSGRDSRSGAYSDHSRSRDHLRNVDKYSRDKYDSSGHKRDKNSSSERAGTGRRHAYYEETERDAHMIGIDAQDEKREYRRSTADHRSDRMLSHEESKSMSKKDDGKYRAKEGLKSEMKEMDGENHSKEEKKRYDDRETNRSKDRYGKEPAEHSGEKCDFGSEDKEYPAKRHKLFSSNNDVDSGKSVSKFTSTPDGRETCSSKQAQDGRVTVAQAQANNSEFANDLNAAKVAAMKAAELVNKNLVGAGTMTTDQKKKLLWGNKKSTTAEESGHHWDAALFSDRERQEKFNKLMSLRLPWCLWPIVGCEGRGESRAQTRRTRWWQRSPSREAERSTVGFGEAVHCWTPEERWSYCWTRSLSVCSRTLGQGMPNFIYGLPMKYGYFYVSLNFLCLAYDDIKYESIVNTIFILTFKFLFYVSYYYNNIK